MHATLPLVELRPHPHNPRGKVTPKDVEDLVALIQKQGHLAPIVCHQVDGKPGYEILAGHRRAVALQVLGRETVDCNVLDRDAAVDWEALLLSEQLSHKDLPPFATAGHVARLCARPGATVKSVAAELEKPREWVALRQALANLAPEIRKAHEDPKGRMTHWTVGMLEILAKLPQETQKNLVAANNGWWVKDITDEAQVRRGIAIEEHTLKDAPFDVLDATLMPKAGACNGCPNHTHAQPDLFGIREGDTKDLGKSKCLLPRCYLEKVEAHNKRAIAAARQANPDLLLVHGVNATGAAPQQQMPGALHSYEYRAAKPNAKGAKPAYVLDGEGAGKTIHVIPARPELARPARAKEKAPAEKKQPTVEERKARLEMRRRALLVDKVRERVARSEAPTAVVTAALLAAFGATDNWVRDGSGVVNTASMRRVYAAHVRGIDAGWAKRIWWGVKVRIGNGLERPSAQVSDDQNDRARWVCEVLGFDLEALDQEVETEIPAPKALLEQARREVMAAALSRVPAPTSKRGRRARGLAAAAGDRDDE